LTIVEGGDAELGLLDIVLFYPGSARLATACRTLLGIGYELTCQFWLVLVSSGNMKSKQWQNDTV